MSEDKTFTVQLEQGEGFEFHVRFDVPSGAEALLDEPVPLGKGNGPNAVRLVAAAVGNCLASGLVFCLRNKFRENLGPVRATAVGRLERNVLGRYRIAGIEVSIALPEGAEALKYLDRCLEQFEDFCVVTESIRHGIPVSVKVLEPSPEKV
jgi:hypothetical protein